MSNLKAGAATSNITPWLGGSIPGNMRQKHSEDVDDELLAKALILESDGTRVAFVTCDLIAIPQEVADAAKARIAERTAIPASHVMVNGTHTHSGAGIADLLGVRRDPDYIGWVPLKIADAVELAVRRLRPARIGFATAAEDRIVYNRRWRMKDGTVRMNPGLDNPDAVEPTGPVDPELVVMYLEAEDGAPISVVANYALHYIGVDDPASISADYFGHFFRRMRHILGDGCVPLLWNGAAGQINNIPFGSSRRWSHRGHAQARRMADVLAGHVLTEIQLMDMQDDLRLDARLETFEFPRKVVAPEDLALADRILAMPEGAYEPDEGPFSWVVGHPIQSGIADIYAQECKRLADMPERLTAPVQVFHLGDAAVAALPGEVFVEIGLRIKQQSPAHPTFLVSLANAYIGYICTDEALTEQGGYETWAALSSLGAAGTAPAAEALAVKLLQRA